MKEATYHLERSADTVIGLGDGTEESHARMQAALDRLWPYTGEAFAADAIDEEAAEAGIAPAPESLRPAFREKVEAVMEEATLTIPEPGFAHYGGKTGFRHSEHLGHILTQMQWLQRAYPGAAW
jgi:ring-1,2-phenylacetyl-CoA epoxidase subunit PaaC